MSRKKKPEGLAEFQKLLKPLAQVSKAELDKQVEQHKKKAVKRKK